MLMKKRGPTLPVLISLALVLFLFTPLILYTGHIYAVYLNDRDLDIAAENLDAQLSDLKTDIELHLMNMDSMDALLRSGDPQTVVDQYFFAVSISVISSCSSIPRSSMGTR